jgi:hypothetical protein
VNSQRQLEIGRFILFANLQMMLIAANVTDVANVRDGWVMSYSQVVKLCKPLRLFVMHLLRFRQY